MSPARAVLHVMRKDMRYARWHLAAYIATIAVVTAGWFGGSRVLLELAVPLAAAIAILAMLIAGMIILEDSPALRTRYWASLPLDASTVLLAKLATVLVALIAPALVAQAVVLSTFQLPAGELAMLLPRTANTFASLLLFAMLMGSLARDTRMLMLLLIGVPVGAMLLVPMVYVRVPPDMFSESVHPGVRLVTLAALAALISHQYLTRRTRRTVGLAVTLAAALMAAPLIPYRLAAAEVTGNDDHVSIGAELLPTSSTPGQLDFRLFVAATESTDRYEVRRLTARLVSISGNVEPLSVSSTRLTVAEGTAPVPDGLRLLGDPAAWPPRGMSAFSVSLSPAQRSALQEGAVRVELSGLLAVAGPQVDLEFPAEAGLVHSTPGQRIFVEGVEASSTAVAVDLAVLQVSGGPSGWEGAGPLRLRGQNDGALLVNRRRSEAIRLSQRSFGSNMPAPIVVPGITVARLEARLESQSPAQPASWSPDRAWLEDLALVLFRWEDRSVRPFRLQVPVSPADG